MTSQPDIRHRPLRVVAGTHIWDSITPLLHTSDDIFAALAHIGSNADSLLPLRSGATIITDASEASIREGSTDPEVLLAWVRRGVKVFSLPGLNAKVILAEGERPVAVVGSADPTWTSAHTNFEAGLITDDVEAVGEIRTTLVAWLNQTQPRAPLTEAWLEGAADFYGADLLGDSDPAPAAAPVVAAPVVAAPVVAAPVVPAPVVPAPVVPAHVVPAPPAAAAPPVVPAPVVPAPVVAAPVSEPVVVEPAASGLAAEQTVAEPELTVPAVAAPAATHVAESLESRGLDKLDQQQDLGQQAAFEPTAAAVEAVAAISPPVDMPLPAIPVPEPLPPLDITWKRPAGIFLSPMDSAGLPSRSAMETLEELHEEEGLPFNVDERGHTLGDPDFSLEMFWWDETGDFTEQWKFPKGRFVVPLQTMGRRMGVTAKASPPGLVRHCYTDHSANPPRTYYYVLVRHSAVRNVTFKDVQRNFAEIGAKPEFDSCFWVQAKIDALLNLWPDIAYDD